MSDSINAPGGLGKTLFDRLDSSDDDEGAGSSRSPRNTTFRGGDTNYDALFHSTDNASTITKKKRQKKGSRSKSEGTRSKLEGTRSKSNNSSSANDSGGSTKDVYAASYDQSSDLRASVGGSGSDLRFGSDDAEEEESWEESPDESESETIGSESDEKEDSAEEDEADDDFNFSQLGNQMLNINNLGLDRGGDTNVSEEKESKKSKGSPRKPKKGTLARNRKPRVLTSSLQSSRHVYSRSRAFVCCSVCIVAQYNSKER